MANGSHGAGHLKQASYFIIAQNFNFSSLSVLFAGFLHIADLFPENPHKKMMRQLHNAEEDVVKELNDKEFTEALGKLNDRHSRGTVLGVFKYTGKAVVLPDHDINHILLVLGTTGVAQTESNGFAIDATTPAFIPFVNRIRLFTLVLPTYEDDTAFKLRILRCNGYIS